MTTPKRMYTAEYAVKAKSVIPLDMITKAEVYRCQGQTEEGHPGMSIRTP